MRQSERRPGAGLRLPAFLLSVLLPLLLCGCWVSEQMNARVRIERDGAYSALAEGTAWDAATLAELRGIEADERAGRLKPEEVKARRAELDGKFQKGLEPLRKDKRILALTVLETGRVRYSIACPGSIGGGALIYRELFAPLAYAQAPDGTLRVQVKDAVAAPAAAGLGLKADGDLAVVLAEGIEVLEHNAQRAPTGPRGAYRWRIEGQPGPAPFLRLRLPQSEAPAPPAQKGLVGRAETR